jgi:MoaA/NifB/PqqE/SkfB family radical SAM enzyme
MRVCCTANASSVGKTNDKVHGGQVGILKTSDGRPANLNTTSLLDAWNNDYMKGVRRQMLDGEKPPSCLKCYKEEEAGHNSKRMWETAYWDKHVNIDQIIAQTGEDGSVPPNIIYIDIRMGTKCQLACVMCSPHDSSQWVKDWQKIYPKVENQALKETMVWDNKGRNHGASYNWHKDNPIFWDQLYDQIPNMKQLYFAGGEALVIEEHYTFLEEVIRRGYGSEIELRYNSNGVDIPDRMLNIWKHFKKVRFHYSIDSYGEMNDYIRYPSKWDHQVNHFHLLDNTDANVEVTVACAVQALNIFYIPELVHWKLEQNFKKINAYPLGAGLINWHFVYHPPHLNPKVLPLEFKKKVAEKIENHIEWLKDNFDKITNKPSDKNEWLESGYGIKRLRGLVSFMMSEDWSNRMPEFREYIRRIDETRGTDFRKTFPEMAYLLDE